MYLHYALPIYTASAIALRRRQQGWLPAAAPDHRVLGVFVPMVEVLAGVSWRDGAPVPHTSHPGRVAPDGMVAVFATQRTIHSGAYPFAIGLRAPHLRGVKLGRASWRERVCPYVWFSVGAGAFKKKI